MAADLDPDAPTPATLTVVGCAGSVPGPDSASSCYLVVRDGFGLLLDIGTGAVGPLQRHRPAERVDAAFITHAHPDHCQDLNGLMYLRHRVGHREPFPVYGPPQVGAAFSGDTFRFGPLPPALGPWKLRTAPAAHMIDNWAVRLDDALCYTGDSAPCTALDELADGCAVLLAEASGFDADRPAHHLTAGDAGRLARRGGARLLVLTHLRAWQDHAALLDEAAAVAGCPVVLAQPGLRISLPG